MNIELLKRQALTYYMLYLVTGYKHYELSAYTLAGMYLDAKELRERKTEIFKLQLVA